MTIEDNSQLTMKIAIQGYPGAFHEIAARYYEHEKNVEVLPADTFRQLVRMVEDKTQVDAGIMAIENTIAGSLLGNYRLLNEHNVKIVGEVYLRIKQNLMVLPGQRIEDLTEVYSHPIALQQCTSFLEEYPNLRVIESIDTALSAKMIREKNMTHAAAIASSLAAEMYDLEIIAPSIETYKKNFTRFLMLRRPEVIPIVFNINKVSICFKVTHSVGRLHKVLEAMANNNVNLTKIQSMPIPDEGWHYFFFIDFTFDDARDYEKCIYEIERITEDLKILGAYQVGKHYE